MSETIRLINKSDHRVRQMIDGEILVVPVNGELVTSVQKGQRMLQDHPQELTDDAEYKLHSRYSEEEFEAINRLDANALRKILRVVMTGNKADIKAALADQTAQKK
jgi:hypothetical protein